MNVAPMTAIDDAEVDLMAIGDNDAASSSLDVEPAATSAWDDEAGMTTIEYALGSLAAAALAAVLIAVVKGGEVMSGIQGVISNALSQIG